MTHPSGATSSTRRFGPAPTPVLYLEHAVAPLQHEIVIAALFGEVCRLDDLRERGYLEGMPGDDCHGSRASDLLKEHV